MRTKLEMKIKKKLLISEKTDSNILRSIDKVRSFIIASHTIRNENEIKITRDYLNDIVIFCKLNNYTNIAVNIDLVDHQSYFIFKRNFQDVFIHTDIETTFFLNKVIELKTVEIWTTF